MSNPSDKAELSHDAEKGGVDYDVQHTTSMPFGAAAGHNPLKREYVP